MTFEGKEPSQDPTLRDVIEIMNSRFSTIYNRMENIDEQLGEIKHRLSNVEAKVDDVQETLEGVAKAVDKDAVMLVKLDERVKVLEDA